MTSAYEPWDEARSAEIIAEHDELEGATLPILHGLQEEFGYVPEPLPMIASALKMSRAEVHGVFTFYHDFRNDPAGRHVLKLAGPRPASRRAATRSPRAPASSASARKHHGRSLVTLEPVYCLGLCACAPSAMLDGRVIGRLDEARIEAIVAEVRA